MPSTTDALLLDANVLIAVSVVGHEHHRRAREWLGGSRRFATSPTTQGSLVRYLVRVASTDHAIQALDLIGANERHEFWPDDAPYAAPATAAAAASTSSVPSDASASDASCLNVKRHRVRSFGVTRRSPPR